MCTYKSTLIKKQDLDLYHVVMFYQMSALINKVNVIYYVKM